METVHKRCSTGCADDHHDDGGTSDPPSQPCTKRICRGLAAGSPTHRNASAGWKHDLESTSRPARQSPNYEYADFDVRNGGYYLLHADGQAEAVVDQQCTRTPAPPRTPTHKDSVARFIVEHRLRFRPAWSGTVITYGITLRGNGEIDHICADARSAGRNDEQVAFIVGEEPLDPVPGVSKLSLSWHPYRINAATAFVSWVKERAVSSPVLLVGFGTSFSSRTSGADVFNSKACGRGLPAVFEAYDARRQTHDEQRYFSHEGSGVSHSTLFGHNVHIVDLRKWLSDDYAINPREMKPEDNTLSAHLSAAGIARERTAETPWRKTLQDVEALHDLMDRRDFAAKLTALLSSTGLPISFALFQSLATCALVSFSRDLYDASQDVHFPFCPPKEAGGTFRGGLNLRHDKVHIKDLCFMLDFAGFYPGVIQAFGLSPFLSILESDTPINPTGHVVVHNTGDEAEPSLKEWIGIPRTKTAADLAFRKVIDQLIARRDAAKQDRAVWSKKAGLAESDTEREHARRQVHFFEHLQLALKRRVNSIYGLIGSKKACYWSNRKVAAVITLLGRLIISKAKDVVTQNAWGMVVFIDTDSLCIRPTHALPALDPDNPASVEAFRAEVGDMARQIEAAAITAIPFECDKSRFRMLLDDVMISAMFPKQMKSYIKLSLAGAGTAFGYRGFQFSERTNYVRETTLLLAERLLRKPADWSDETKAFTAAHRIACLVSPDKYARLIRIDGGAVGSSLVRRFPELADERDAWCVLTQHVGPDADAWVPVAKFDSSRHSVDIDRTFAFCYGHNLGRYFPELVPAATLSRSRGWPSADGHVVDDGKVHVRSMPDNWTFAIAASSIHDILPTTKACYYEQFTRDENRLFFDLDNATGVDVRRFVHDLMTTFGFPAPVILDGGSGLKKSYHVIFPTVVQLAYNESIARYASTALGYKCVDLGLYGIGKSLRMPLCPKFVKQTHVPDGAAPPHPALEQRCFRLPEDEPIKNESASELKKRREATLESCLITNTAGIRRWRDCGMAFSSRPPINIYGKSSPLDIEALPAELKAFLDKTLPGGWTVQLLRSLATARIVPAKFPYTCPLCKRTHDHDFMRIDRCGDAIKLGCFRTDGRDGSSSNKRMTFPLGGITKKKKKGERWDACDMIKAYIDSWILPSGVEMPKLGRIAMDAFIKMLFILSQPKTEKTTRVREFAEQLAEELIQAERENPAKHVGDTELEQILKKKRIILLWISFRRTFTTDAVSKMDMTDYRDIQGTIVLEDGTRVIVQIDSILRLQFTSVPIDLLILDEIESIQNQLYNALQHNAGLTHKFRQLLIRSERVIVMDAMLNDATIKALTDLAGVTSDKVRVVRNYYKPFPMHAEVYQIKLSLPDEVGHMVDTIRKFLKAGDRVECVVSSRRLAEALDELFRAEGYQVLTYTGNDLRVDKGESMYARKCRDFTGISDRIKVDKVQLLIHTTTLSAGVSIETAETTAEELKQRREEAASSPTASTSAGTGAQPPPKDDRFEFTREELDQIRSTTDEHGVPWFHRLVGYYCTAINAIDFCQAVCRVRDFQKHECVIYIELTFEACFDATPLECAQRLKLLEQRAKIGVPFTPETHYDVFLAARNAALRRNAWKYMFQSLACLGYTFNVRRRSESKSETKLDVFGKDAQKVHDTALTTEHMATVRKLDKDELKTKLELTDPTFEYAHLKYKVMKQLRLTVDEINKVPVDVFESALPHTGAKDRATRFLRIQRETYDVMKFPGKLNVIRYAFGLNGVNYDEVPAKLVGELEEMAARRRKSLQKKLDKEVAMGRSAIETKQREMEAAECCGVMRWLQTKGCTVTVDSWVAKRIAKNKLTTDMPHDEITREFMALFAKVSPCTWAKIGVNKKTDPCTKIAELLKYSGATVLPLVRDRLMVNGIRHRTCKLSVAFPAGPADTNGLERRADPDRPDGNTEDDAAQQQQQAVDHRSGRGCRDRTQRRRRSNGNRTTKEIGDASVGTSESYTHSGVGIDKTRTAPSCFPPAQAYASNSECPSAVRSRMSLALERYIRNGGVVSIRSTTCRACGMCDGGVDVDMQPSLMADDATQSHSTMDDIGREDASAISILTSQRVVCILRCTTGGTHTYATVRGIREYCIDAGILAGLVECAAPLASICITATHDEQSCSTVRGGNGLLMARCAVVPHALTALLSGYLRWNSEFKTDAVAHWHARESIGLTAAAESGTYEGPHKWLANPEPAGIWKSLANERDALWKSFLEQNECIKCNRPRKGETTTKQSNPYCAHCLRDIASSAPGAPATLVDIRVTIDVATLGYVRSALDWLNDIEGATVVDQRESGHDAQGRGTREQRCATCGGHLARAIPFGKRADKHLVFWGGKLRKICVVCLHEAMLRRDLLAGSHAWFSRKPNSR
jgi:hypothetical protein